MIKTLQASIPKVKHRIQNTVLLFLGILLIGVVLLSASLGAYQIPLESVVGVLSSKLGLAWGSYTEPQSQVLLNIRFPRILMGILIGGGLGLAGAALQGLFRNPLVEPGLIGVSSGGAFFAVVFIVFGAGLTALSPLFSLIGLPLFAFLGGLLVTLLVYNISSHSGKTDISVLILAGVAINALMGALIGLVLFYADDAALRNFTFWSLGDLGGSNWSKLGIATILIIPALAMIMRLYPQLNAMALGEREAYHMGVNVQYVKYVLFLSSALIVGTAVSLSGTIGFVGLVVPHLIRLGFGADHRLVLPGSFLLGAILLSTADLFARNLVRPAELPIGIITALLGAPFFIYLIVNFKKVKY
ncbi:FecCD family ABC transporter permease [Belliella aquatica]|uniref:Hemin ABC transporter permease n=1 Tax=Belliella aquatica TaxID=1323734 RepID=A0ABQ1MYP4_9BACT|nr:iron ABC transporter permease [Belliella aquatica]MCH7404042.1 iron ABC transporter permease [Belliella aquatica]GGC49670.1 hemin ABC transporter permease [Belliella aquatica]